MSLEEFIKTLNAWGSQGIPFLFLMDFEMEKPIAFPLERLPADTLLFDLNGVTNAPLSKKPERPADFIKFPPSFSDYKAKYRKVFAGLTYGDSYLTNLTIKTKVKTEMLLRDIFFLSKAKYKLLYENDFLVFSPETFVRINGGRIFTYPMKGTIDASLPNAREKLLRDKKEMAEHVTIVDLIRNDLSQVADNVEVARFRYIEEIRTMDKSLFQVSSEIAGQLPPDHAAHLGDILVKLLPAGSVSGAPKCKTLQIIRDAEGEKRGYYTGVMGLFDGKNFDSGVMIRFIENDNGTLYYRSGGGITAQSSVENEYHEAIDKVYVPVD